jgi:hypothetical protein
LKERNKKLAEAFGILPAGVKAPQYSDMLLNFVRVSPMLVKRFESMFEEFLRTPASNTKLNLPSMDRVKRMLVHELAKYYHMETHSQDKEPLRSVVVTRTRESKVPNVLLSDYIALRQQMPAQAQVQVQASTPAPQATALSSRGPVAALHIYNLQAYVKTPQLVAFLQPFAGHYKLQWIDDNNCLALFDSELTMRTALSELSGGMFAVKVYKDQLEATPAEFHMTPLRDPSTRDRTRAPIRVSKEDESWRKDDNSFKVLNEVEETTTTTTPSAWDDEGDDSTSSTGPQPTSPIPVDHKPVTTNSSEKKEDVEDGFKVIKSGEELDDWTLLDDSNGNVSNA